MDSFEYLIALVSVIAGLGIARALSGLARLFDARHRITFSWIPICWTFNVLLWLIAFWWFTFMFSSFEGWTPGLHIFVLIYAGAIYFSLALLHPEIIEDGHDMLEHLLNNRMVFFGTLLLLAFIDIADTWIKYRLGVGIPPLTGYLSLVLPWIVMSAIAMFSHSRKYHSAFAAIFLIGIVTWQGYAISGILENVSGGS